MAEAGTYRVLRSLVAVPRMCGAPRQVVGFIILLGAGVVMIGQMSTLSIVASLVGGVVLIALAAKVTAQDPQALEVFIAGLRYADRYEGSSRAGRPAPPPTRGRRG